MNEVSACIFFKIVATFSSHDIFKCSVFFKSQHFQIFQLVQYVSSALYLFQDCRNIFKSRHFAQVVAYVSHMFVSGRQRFSNGRGWHEIFQRQELVSTDVQSSCFSTRFLSHVVFSSRELYKCRDSRPPFPDHHFASREIFKCIQES